MSGFAEEPDETSFFRDVGLPLQKSAAVSVAEQPTRSDGKKIAKHTNPAQPDAGSPVEAIVALDVIGSQDLNPSELVEPKKGPTEPPPLYFGHRDRVRKRFDKIGGEAFEDYELLEIALFGVIPRGDTKDIAKRLLQRFGTFAEVVGAPKHLLQEVEGVGKNAATDLKVLAAVAQRVARGAVMQREALSSWALIVEYLRASMAFDAIEKFRVLYLNKKNLLIADEIQQEGIVDHTPAYPSKVVNRAYNLGATAIVLAHNHPSGDPEPSRADIDLTKAIVAAAKGHGIIIHDHIIIGRSGHASLRALGYI